MTIAALNYLLQMQEDITPRLHRQARACCGRHSARLRPLRACQEASRFFALLGRNILDIIGYTLEFGGNNLVAVIFEVFLHIGGLLEGCIENYVPFIVMFQLVHAVINELQFEVLKRHPILGHYLENSLMVKQKRERTLRTQAAAMFGEIRPNIGHSARIVVCGCLNKMAMP